MEALSDVGVLSEMVAAAQTDGSDRPLPDGRPHHVKATVKIMGLVDKEILEYHWGPDWVVYDAKETSQQHGQHVEYRLQPEGVDKTRVRFDITVEPAGPFPGSSSGGRAKMCSTPRRRDCASGSGDNNG